MASNETVEDIVREMYYSYEGLIAFEFQSYASRIEAAHKREILVERKLADDHLAAKDAETERLRRRLKIAEDALEKASDAFRFCIEQCELELGPKMIGKLCDDGRAVEHALDALETPVENADVQA